MVKCMDNIENGVWWLLCSAGAGQMRRRGTLGLTANKQTGVERRAAEQIWGAGIITETSPVALITVKGIESRNCLERGFLSDVS